MRRAPRRRISGRRGAEILLFTIGLAAAGASTAPSAHAASCRRVAPSQFGRVFRANRSALVRVRAEKPGARWVDGVVIGARSEILFGFSRGLGSRVRVRLPSGLEQGATVLGLDRGLGVALARVDGAEALVPPKVALEPDLSPECWVVVLTHGKDGAATSHAGQIAGPATKGKVPVEVPGRPGSPVLGPDGALVGVSVSRGRRRVSMRTMPQLMPFLERVVMGGAGD